MEAVVLVIHLIVAFSLVLVVLLQNSEGGGLGIGGGGGMGNFAGQRSTADFMTKATTLLGVVFVSTSLLLAVLATHKTSSTNNSILDIKAKDITNIQNILDDETIGNEDLSSSVPEAPEGGVIAVPQAPKAVSIKKSEKPSAPVSK